LRDIIREIVDAGTTVLFSSHLVHELEGIVDQVGILHDGKLLIETDYHSLKKTMKRVSLAFDSPVHAELRLEGVLTEKRYENGFEVVIYPWDDEMKPKMEALKPSEMKVESMSLEDTFVSFVSSRPQPKIMEPNQC
jgi:ABC-2 type transport system ATP-binding protein